MDERMVTEDPRMGTGERRMDGYDRQACAWERLGGW